MPSAKWNTKRELTVEWFDLSAEWFRLWRSTNEFEGFEIVEERIEVPYYLDTEVELGSVDYLYFYKVEGFNGMTQVVTSKAFSPIYNEVDYIARRVQKDAETMLRVMKNPPVFLLSKRRVGMKCPNCWDPVLRKVKFSNCKVCDGTGEVQGYFKPIQIRLSTNVSSYMGTLSVEDVDKVTLTPIEAWTTGYPRIFPGDVIVDRMNKRYKVQNVSPRTHAQQVVRQLLSLIYLEVGHPVYDVEVDFREEAIKDVRRNE